MIEGIEGVSSFAAQLDYTFWIVNLICLILFIVTIGAMFIFIFKYDEKKSKPKDTKNIKHNTPLEIAWTVIPTILLMIVFYVGLDALKIQRTMPKDKDAIVINVVGKKWVWVFEYPNGKKSSTLVVPVNKDIKLKMTAPVDDILHSFSIAAFRIKEDVVPGATTRLWFNANKKGEYDIQCTEYCGTRHSYMRSTIKVVSSEDYEEFLNPKIEEIKTAQDIMTETGCIGCHSLDGSAGVGPTFKDIYNTEVKVNTNGVQRVIKRDEEYLIKAINYPNADIVEGYMPNMMPSYINSLSKEELNTIINYFKGIKPKPKKPKLDGKELALTNGCIGCHSIDGSKSAGPTFKGIFNRKTKVLRDGKLVEVIANEEYLIKAIKYPAVELVEGYYNIMPPYKDVLKDEEIKAIVEYLKK